MSADRCRFCRANGLLLDAAIGETEHFYILPSADPAMPLAAMVIPHRHSETPFEMTAHEWADFPNALGSAQALMVAHEPDGFTLGWNVGAVGGQNVFHTHLHIIPRFATEPLAGKGLRYAFRNAHLLKDAI